MPTQISDDDMSLSPPYRPSQSLIRIWLKPGACFFAACLHVCMYVEQQLVWIGRSIYWVYL